MTGETQAAEAGRRGGTITAPEPEQAMRPDADPGKLIEMALRVWGYKQGEVVSLMIYLGDRLGLYQALRGAGPLTADELGARTGLHPRWLLEWLRCQAAAGLVGSAEGEVFDLSPEAAALLADEDTSTWFAAGAFHGCAAPRDTVDRLARAFRTGGGLTFDDLGEDAAARVERTLGPWSRLALVPAILPVLDGVTARLEVGGKVADVGCGSGVTLLTVAAAFPNSVFDGYDPSRIAIDRAEHNLAGRGLANVTFHHEAAEDLPAGPVFDLVLTFDCLHDMLHAARRRRPRQSVLRDPPLNRDRRAAAAHSICPFPHRDSSGGATGGRRAGLPRCHATYAACYGLSNRALEKIWMSERASRSAQVTTAPSVYSATTRSRGLTPYPYMEGPQM